MAAISVILLIISGIAGVILTVWGRVVPPETKKAKVGFVVVGGISVACIISVGILNAISQNRLNSTIQNVAENVQKLAGPAKVTADHLSVDQILSAAAEKLIEQDKKLKTLNEDLQKRIQPANGIYIDDKLVGQSMGQVIRNGGHLTFQAIFAGGDGIDFSKPMEYQRLKLRCQPSWMSGSLGGLGVTTEWRYPNVECDIVNG
jgi:hypothetical protein